MHTPPPVPGPEGGATGAAGPEVLLSACILARDEEARLPRCLTSLRGLADEVVLVDTGSRDGTRAVALQGGARVLDFPWIDDFAAARNHGLAACRGRWILSIDADEWVMEGAAAGLLAPLTSPEAVAFSIGLVNLLPGGASNEERLTRLFRRRPDVRWRGIIHEQVTEDLARVALKERLQWRQIPGRHLLHDGYLVADPGRGERNLRLLTRACALDPKDMYLRAKLAETLDAASALPHHLDVARDLLGMGPAELALRPWTEPALLNGALRIASLRPDLALEAADRCAAVFGAHPVQSLVRARAHLSQGQWAQALAVADHPVPPRPGGPAFPEAATAAELAYCGATAALRLCPPQEVRSRLDRALEVSPDHPHLIHLAMRQALETRDLPRVLELGARRLRADPKDQVCLDLCASVARALGEPSALDPWRKALRNG